ncbi:hypothetical protein QBC34DRAFT_381659 [Podospora aff. communis PSN243]|uniref:Uncharacterized protein n=1 Tax=Podospora aff. communis PSN243 TaxID=3040156 RepID=A0AAV9GI21_9PEZI|nr:hypothetical protein QBC34DRAFT_381659 [Podospora aff. communis PSN243]
MDSSRQPVIASTESSPTTEEQTRSSSPSNRRDSIEWDASKVPPSRFQKRKGSIYAVPSSRDGHIDSNYNTKFHEKHAELWKDGTPTTSSGSGRRDSNAGSTTSTGRRESNAGLFGGRRGSNAN